MRTLMLAMRRLLIGVASIYCFGMVVLMVLWTTRVQQTWWLALSNVFALYLFTPLLLIVPAALLVRSRWLRSAAVVSLATFLVLFGVHLIPPPARQESGIPLRVMTLNQLYANERVDDLIAAIRAQNADVVAIQELSAPVAAAARQQLSAEYPYQVLASAEGDYGLGLLSRYPLLAPMRDQEFVGQQATLDIGGRRVILINVHLTAPSIKTRRFRPLRPMKFIWDYDTSERERDFFGLLRAIDESHGPLIVLGDFNTGDREPAHAELAARLHDVYGETAWGFGFTFPNDKQLVRLRVPFPLVRIDYVWSRSGVAPAAARVECQSGGSDHCMVVADLRVGADDREPRIGDMSLSRSQ